MVGWENSASDVFVITVLLGVNEHALSMALEKGVLFMSAPYPVGTMIDLCGEAPLQIVGLINEHQDTKAKLLATYEINMHFPRFQMPAYPEKTFQMIVYDKPRPESMQYISLYPVSLEISQSRGGLVSQPKEHREARLVEKMKRHAVAPTIGQHEISALQININQVNCSYELSVLLRKHAARIAPKTRGKRSLSVGDRVRESATTARHAAVSFLLVLWRRMLPCFISAFKGIIILGRSLAEVFLQVLDYKVRPDVGALKDVFAIGERGREWADSRPTM